MPVYRLGFNAQRPPRLTALPCCQATIRKYPAIARRRNPAGFFRKNEEIYVIIINIKRYQISKTVRYEYHFLSY